MPNPSIYHSLALQGFLLNLRRSHEVASVILTSDDVPLSTDVSRLLYLCVNRVVGIEGTIISESLPISSKSLPATADHTVYVGTRSICMRVRKQVLYVMVLLWCFPDTHCNTTEIK